MSMPMEKPTYPKILPAPSHFFRSVLIAMHLLSIRKYVGTRAAIFAY